jgi:hypothetical protein
MELNIRFREANQPASTGSSRNVLHNFILFFLEWTKFHTGGALSSFYQILVTYIFSVVSKILMDNGDPLMM